LSDEGFAWRGSRPQTIETRRAHLSDLLIFDILLTRGGIQEPDLLWPPQNVAGLRRLLDAIQASSYDSLKMDCLVYFLLKWHQDGRESKFAEDLVLPPQFTSLTDAYWHLDSGIDIAVRIHFPEAIPFTYKSQRAVHLLSDARVHREHSSKIIQALSLSSESSSLIVRFVRTVKPILSEQGDIDAYLLALASSSLLDAWMYQRSFPEEGNLRARLLDKLFEWCFSRK
jgi:hypothetical protein